MKQKSKKLREQEVDAQLEALTHEELLQAMKESIKKCDELAVGVRSLMNHMKVLCHRAGGTIFYTKDEFDAAAKADPDLEEEYGMEGKTEVCFLRAVPREDQVPLKKNNKA